MWRTLWLVLLMTGVAHAAGDFCLVRDGQPAAEIVIGADPSGQAAEAAAELRTYLQRLSGAELPIVAQPSGRLPAVLVGQRAAATAARAAGLKLPSGLTDSFEDEGYLVATAGDTLILAGNETDPYQGTYYAVYDLLESLGCRWYFPGEFGEVVPAMRTIRIAPVSKLVKPDLRVRDTWYSGHLAQQGGQSGDFQTWKRRNRMSQTRLWMHCADPEAKFLQNPVDDSTYRLLPKDRYWESHPEYYAMLPGGARNERFLCMSNAGALRAATDTVVGQFRARPDHHTFAFSPPDEPVLCNCPDCTRAMHGQYAGEGCGNVSDAYMSFVFRLADAVGNQAPGKWITTMAYYNRCRPPEGVEGRRNNLLIQLASIQQCTLHSYADRNCWSRQEFGSMLRRWQELSAGQVFYEYDPHDWSHSQRPGWRSQGIAEDLRLLKQGGGWGYSNEGQMAWMATGLNYYVRARLSWGLNQDPQAIVADFCGRFFGPAARPMLRYYTGVEAAIRNSPTHLFAFSEDARDNIPVLFPAPFRAQCARQLVEATRLAAAEPYASRVKAFRLHFDRMDAGATAHEAALRGDYTAASKSAAAMIQTVSDTANTALLQDAGPWGGNASGLGMKEYYDRIAPWTDGRQGKLIAALPTETLFRPDPASQGLVHRWYLPTVSAKQWRPLKMVTAWQHQGIVTAEGRPYKGVAWYRVAVDYTGGADDVLGMCVPYLRGSALWLWSNGEFAGYMTPSDQDPVMDLTGRLRPGRNALVFRVEGDGGLCRPPFLFRSGSERLAEVPVLPAQWLFRTDPQDQGQRDGWQRPDLAETDWRAIPVGTNWETTTVGPYDGVAWYRARFTVPAELAGKKLVLRFGAVDEEAWVYLNGELVGEHSTGSTGQTVHQIWDKSFDVPLPNARAGQENVLAVRVRDALMAGGIHRPVRLYVVGGKTP